MPCKRTYQVGLCYDALHAKTMEVAAETLSEACEFAMAHADDDGGWRDTLVSSTHWIESVDDEPDLVPEECSEAAICAGGAVLIAYRLRDALKSLVEACEQDHWALRAVGADVERAKGALEGVPDRILSG